MSRITLALAILALSPQLFSQGPPPPPPPVPPVPVPAGNPITAAKTNLGMSLFWDEQLSSTRTVACGSCHISAAGGSDPRSGTNLPSSRHPGPDGIFGTGDDIVGSPGVSRSDAHGLYLFDPSFRLSPQVTGRKANSSINAAFAAELFWDGRATTEFRDPDSGNVVLATGAALESQVLGPPLSDVEMAHVGRDWQEVTQRIGPATPLALAENVPASLAAWIGRRSYAELFDEVFGTPDVSAVRIALAIATYERTLVSDQSRLDAGTLNFQEQQGRQVFNSPQSRCRACHAGPLFTDDQFHYTGVRPPQEDIGRQAVTGLPQDRGRFRTPGLRNVGLREPLFHNGRMATLEDVVDFYNRGGDFNAPNKAPAIAPLGLTTQQRAALVAFLRSGLTDARVANETGPFERPTLYSESARVPTQVGGGLAGSGALVPRMIALEPARVGNPSMTFGLENALGGAQAMFLLSYAPPGRQNPFTQTGPMLASARGPLRYPVGALLGAGVGNGFASVSVKVPGSSALIGSEFFGRWYVADPGASGGVASSATVSFKLF